MFFSEGYWFMLWFMCWVSWRGGRRGCVLRFKMDLEVGVKVDELIVLGGVCMYLFVLLIFIEDFII